MINGKKIAIDARMIEMSGIGRYIQNIINNGIYDVALGDEALIRKYNKSIKVIQYKEKIYGLCEQLKFPVEELKVEQIQLVHFPHYNVPILYKGDFVVTVHDLTHIIFPKFMKNKIASLYAKILLKNACEKSKHIFTVSENSKKDIEKYFDIKQDKISITYDAVDDKYKKVDIASLKYLREKYNISEKQKVILYVGNLKKHKNLNRLLQAFSQLNDIEHIRMILVGKDFDNENLDNIEKRLKIENYIIHTGVVNDKELVDLYNLADIFIFPSLYEGFGIPLLEAMACETIVLCSNTSSMPEVVGDAAVLFNPYEVSDIANSIQSVINEQIDSNEYIKKGIKQYRKFSWEDSNKEIIATITRLCSIK